MTRRFVADMLLVTTMLGAALCVARGFLHSSTSLLLGAWGLALCGVVVWLLLRRMPEEPLPEIDETLAPKPATRPLR